MPEVERVQSGLRRTRVPIRGSLAALITGAVLVAGCSASSPQTHAARDTTSTTLDAHEQGVRYADCMRENGVPHFPDPEASGEFPSFGIDVNPQQWAKTVDACKQLQPASVDYSGKMSPAQLSAALKFAQCVRDNGVKDFPDPVSGEPLIDTTKIPSTDSKDGMAILNAATKKCSALIEAAMRERDKP